MAVLMQSRQLAFVAVVAAVSSFTLGLDLTAQYNGVNEDHGTLRLGVGCDFCAAVLAKVFDKYVQSGDPLSVSGSLVPLCVQLQLASEDVCQGVVHTYLPSVIYLADRENNSATFSDRLCRLIINKEDCILRDEWSVALDENKPQIASPAFTKTSEERMTVLHLTDVHYDPFYTSTNSCRSVAGAPPAGYWGAYTGCDVPMRTFTSMLQHIRQQHKKIDYVYFTGDIVDHVIWETTAESNQEAITAVVNTLAEFFGNVTVVHTIGNHEPSPVNLFSPIEVEDGNVSTAWLYQLMSELWSPYITEEAKRTVLKGGYYTLKLRDGFRVIVLNNAVSYNLNFWLMYESEDPYGQLKWLAETLLQAEKDQEKVHLLYHIPTGSKDCVRTWSREFHKIVDRFENTITAQFNGHTHFDEFHVYYDIKNSSRANNVALNGGSVTSYENVNMNYKVYTVDPSSWYVIDGESWVFNLTEANLHPGENPKWYKLYSYSEAFGVRSLVPSEMDSLVRRMSEDHILLQKYNRYYVKDASPSLRSGCDNDCLKSRLCDIATADSSEAVQCNQLLLEFDASLLPTTTVPTLSTTGASGNGGNHITTTRHLYLITVALITAAAGRLSYRLR